MTRTPFVEYRDCLLDRYKWLSVFMIYSRFPSLVQWIKRWGLSPRGRSTWMPPWTESLALQVKSLRFIHNFGHCPCKTKLKCLLLCPFINDCVILKSGIKFISIPSFWKYGDVIPEKKHNSAYSWFSFFIGGTVSVAAKINNMSSKTMKPKFSLQQRIVYHAECRTNVSDLSLCKMVGDTVTPKSKEIVTCQVKVPEDAVCTLHNCEIISVDYYIKVCDNQVNTYKL